MMPKDEQIQPEELEKLFINNEDFNAMSGYMNRFNPIKIMGMENMEIRHSAILAWLLNPNETHGFGGRFLKGFLGEAFRGSKERGGINALSISQAHFNDIEVRREWQNIDIFIYSRSKSWAFIIENKFYSEQSKDQLKTYREKIEGIYGDKVGKKVQVRGVFLTLFDEPPEDDNFVTIKYESICEILKQSISANKSSMATDVLNFINQYLEVIEEACDMNDQHKNMEALARELYRTHKKALDFIIEHGASNDFTLAAHKLFGENAAKGQEININEVPFIFGSYGTYTSFLPKCWFDALGGQTDKPWEGCENYGPGFPISTSFRLIPNKKNEGGKLFLYAGVGPMSELPLRDSLIQAIKAKAVDKKLVSFSKNVTGKYSSFLKGNSVVIHDVQDPNEISKKMRELLEKFTPVFDSLSEALQGFASNLEANQS